LAQNQDNVSECGDIWFLLLQWASAIKLQLNLYVINSLKIKKITISQSKLKSILYIVK
jgi:hypothetical protein